MALPDNANPMDLFASWFEDAGKQKCIEDRTAMSLATADADGNPDVRMVLLKQFDEHGFVFYTNLGSVKASHLNARPKAALCFYWEPLERQVRIRGNVVPVSPEEADHYYDSRPRDSRIGAWASIQSTPLESLYALEKRVALFSAKFAVGRIPRPEFWSGYRVIPERIEFWIKRPFHLHERLVFFREGPEEAWKTERLYP